MDYQLSIREHNIPAHLDIEADIKAKKNGQFTFTIRVNNGDIVDYNLTEYVTIQQYLSIKRVIIV